MPDRQRVYYKTPLHRFIEIALVVLLALVLTGFWHLAFPDVSASFPLVLGLALGSVVVPYLGTVWAESRGAPLVTREERSRRYLSELRPLGLLSPPNAQPALSLAQRKSPTRRARRG